MRGSRQVGYNPRNTLGAYRMCDDEVKAYASDEFIYDPVIVFRKPTDTAIGILHELLAKLPVSPRRDRFNSHGTLGSEDVDYRADLAGVVDYYREKLTADYTENEREIDPSWGRFEYGIGYAKDDRRLVSVWLRIFSPHEGGSIIVSSSIRRVGRNKYWMWEANDNNGDEEAENNSAE